MTGCGSGWGSLTRHLPASAGLSESGSPGHDWVPMSNQALGDTEVKPSNAAGGPKQQACKAQPDRGIHWTPRSSSIPA